MAPSRGDIKTKNPTKRRANKETKDRVLNASSGGTLRIHLILKTKSALLNPYSNAIMLSHRSSQERAIDHPSAISK